MHKDVAIFIQSNLYWITLDGYCPHQFLEWRPDISPVDPRQRWQIAVDVIHCCMTSGLMSVWNEGWMKSVGVGCAENFAAVFAKNDPFYRVSFDERGVTFWIEPLLCATDLFQHLMKKYSIDYSSSDILCEPLIDEIEKLFIDHHFVFGNHPVIPIGLYTSPVRQEYPTDNTAAGKNR